MQGYILKCDYYATYEGVIEPFENAEDIVGKGVVEREIADGLFMYFNGSKDATLLPINRFIDELPCFGNIVFARKEQPITEEDIKYIDSRIDTFVPFLVDYKLGHGHVFNFDDVVTYEGGNLKVFAMHSSSQGEALRGRIEVIPSSLKGMQAFVGGNIEMVTLDNGVCIILNKDGKLLNLPANRVFLDHRGKPFDVFVGDLFACRVEGEDVADIKEEDIPYILKYLRPIIDKRRGFYSVGNEEALKEYEDEEGRTE